MKISELQNKVTENPLAYIIGGAVLIIGGYYVYKKVKNSVKSTINVVKDELDLKLKGQRLTYPLTTYATLADKLQQAGNGNFGTDEDAIYNAFSLIKNDLDMVQLFKAYGSRRLEFTFTDANLGGYLQSELSDGEINKVNDILKKNGLEFRF